MRSIIWQKFSLAYPALDKSLKIPFRILSPPLSRLLFYYIGTSRIPLHPLDGKAAEIISEGLDALQIYSMFCVDINNAPPSTQSMLLAHFSSVWKWIVFLSPASHNLRDLDVPYKMRDNTCLFSEDGFVCSPLANRMGVCSDILENLVTNDLAVKAMVAQPDFFPELFALITHIPKLNKEIASIMHRLFYTFQQLVCNKDASVATCAWEALMRFEDEHPGLFAGVMIGRLSWFFNPKGTCSGDDYHLTAYSELAPRIATDATLLRNLAATKAHITLVRISVLVTTVFAWLEAEPHQHYVLCLWMEFLGCILGQREGQRRTRSMLVECLDCGLLVFLYRILTVRLEDIREDSREHAANCKALVVRFMDDVVIPMAVWPAVLYALRRSVARGKVLLDSSTLACQDSLQWRTLSRRFEDYDAAHKGFKKYIAELRSCANITCPRSHKNPKLKLCACARAFYCSKACQQAHWRTSHGACCSRDHNGLVTVLSSDITVEAQDMPNFYRFRDLSPSWLTYLDRAFFATCARDQIARYGDPNKLRDRVSGKLRGVRSVLVDFFVAGKVSAAGREHAEITYGAFDLEVEWAKRELGIVESEEQLAMVAVWVRVGISGGQPMVMEVGVMSATDLLGERRD
ncbi:uncharacterized protein SCHCODRAFT_02584607 [Schizophyllum commune H4-8]|nr:uncharacterized protein SCHCODRAFT_02584607 [Schizophyllum commune H4-8]KAI5888920.1 hypothetical protein SCHCODRAFT_02584607 [Schizophyllum commune H4-8]